jgi:hypothetical protein
MTTHGLLIAIEGIDGSGKHTQANLLEHSLRSSGFPVYSTGFPQYDSWFGQMVGKFLNGDFGPLDSIDPRFTALLYAAILPIRWLALLPRSAPNFFGGLSTSSIPSTACLVRT